MPTSSVTIKAAAQKYGPKAVERLAELAGLLTDEGKDAAEKDATQIAALKELLDLGYGKAAPSNEDAGQPLTITKIERVIVKPSS